MQGPIAQALALVCVGNAVIKDRNVAGFWPDASVFAYSNSCDFRQPNAAGTDFDVFAADPMRFYAEMKPHCRGFRLHTAPPELQPGQMPGIQERMLVGFIGGGPRWLIESVTAPRSGIWQGYDRSLGHDRPNNKVWAHSYLLRGQTDPQTMSITPVSRAAETLNNALTEISAFAAKASPDWRAAFDTARAELNGAAPAGGYHVDIARYASLDAQTHRLLAATEHAWVFGAMGSWNDVAPPEPLAAEYERVSESLFRAVIDAITSVANSTYPGQSG